MWEVFVTRIRLFRESFSDCEFSLEIDEEDCPTQPGVCCVCVCVCVCMFVCVCVRARVCVNPFYSLRTATLFHPSFFSSFFISFPPFSFFIFFSFVFSSSISSSSIFSLLLSFHQFFPLPCLDNITPGTIRYNHIVALKQFMLCFWRGLLVR